MEIKILHLYFDLLNLYGEYGNLSILISRLQDQEVKVILEKKTIGDNFDLLDYDFVYVGSGTESHLKIALEDLKKHRNELEKYISQNKFALFTGNSIEMLGKEIRDKEQIVSGLEIFDYKVERLADRKTSDIIFKSELFKDEVVGFINKQGNITESNIHLFEVKFGIGENDDNKFEGAYKNNLYATYVIGPILVRNPHVLKYIVEKMISEKDKDFVIKNLEYKNEDEGYKLVLSELKQRK